MSEVEQISFSHKEIVEALLKKQGIHEGIWGMSVKFGLKALNIGAADGDVNPAALLAVLEIGLQKAEKETNIAVDAAKANPAQKGAKPKKR